MSHFWEDFYFQRVRNRFTESCKSLLKAISELRKSEWSSRAFHSLETEELVFCYDCVWIEFPRFVSVLTSNRAFRGQQVNCLSAPDSRNCHFRSGGRPGLAKWIFFYKTRAGTVTTRSKVVNGISF